MKKDEKPDTLAVINNYKRQTDGHDDSMTDPAQRAESVKVMKYKRHLVKIGH